MTEVSVVVPTYNEEENIEDFVKKLKSELEDYSLEIIIVDDSDDSTASIIRDIDDSESEINLIEREDKSGIGSAYKLGFSRAKGEKIVQMDADFSHRPEQIEKLLEALKDTDIAVGSRYVDGGERNDPFFRRINPLIGSYLYQYALGSPVSDVTSGFKAYKKDTAEEIPEDIPDGFHFQAASLIYLIDNGAEVKEVPIDFRPRRAGEPKYSFEDFTDNVKLLLKLFKSKRLGL